VVTRTALLFCGTLTIVTAACSDTDNASMSPTSTASAYDISVTPSSVVLAPASVFGGFGASSCLTWGAAFDLIVRNFGASDLFLDEATFQLIDGTTLGGPMIPVPSGDLNRRFGQLLIHRGRTRAFRFHERFGCGAKTPQRLRVDARLVGSGGDSSYATIEVPTN
jgi:hypothetical protein